MLQLLSFFKAERNTVVVAIDVVCGDRGKDVVSIFLFAVLFLHASAYDRV